MPAKQIKAYEEDKKYLEDHIQDDVKIKDMPQAIHYVVEFYKMATDENIIEKAKKCDEYERALTNDCR